MKTRTPVPRSALGIHKVAPWLALSLVTLAAMGWVVWLPFQLDDIPIISVSPTLIDSLSESIDALEAEDASDRSGYFLRITSWILYTVESKLSGVPLRPWIFHGTSLAIHLMCVLMLWRILSLWHSASGAFIGGALFALNPAGTQAVSWVAARGDLLVVFFGLAAVIVALNLRKRRAWMAGLGCGLCLSLAMLSKVTGVTVLPIALWALWSANRRWSAFLFASAPIGVAVWLRMLNSGTMFPQYIDGSELADTSLLTMVAKAPSVLGHLLVPWNESVVATSAAPPALYQLFGNTGTYIALTCLTAMLLLPALRPGSNHARRLFSSLILLGVVGLPCWLVVPPDQEWSVSRSFYICGVPLALAVASAVDVAMRNRGKLAWLLIVLASLSTLDSLVHRSRLEIEAGKLIRERIDTIEDRLSVSVDTPPTVVLIDEHSEFASIPLLGPFSPMLFAPPYRRHSAKVLHYGRSTDPRLRAKLLNLTEPICVLIPQHSRAAPLAYNLPALPQTLPDLASSSQASVWQPTHDVPPRAIHALALRLDSGPEIEVKVICAGGETTLSTSFTARARNKPKRYLVDLEPTLEWAMVPSLSSVAIILGSKHGNPAPASPSPLLGAPKLMPRVPSIEQFSPKAHALIKLSDSAGVGAPKFIVSRVPLGADLRLKVRWIIDGAELVVSYAISDNCLKQLPNGTTEITPPQSPSHGPAELGWTGLPQVLKRLRVQGIAEVKTSWSLEHRTADSSAMVARSQWSDFRLSL